MNAFYPISLIATITIVFLSLNIKIRNDLLTDIFIKKLLKRFDRSKRAYSSGDLNHPIFKIGNQFRDIGAILYIFGIGTGGYILILGKEYYHENYKIESVLLSILVALTGLGAFMYTVSKRIKNNKNQIFITTKVEKNQFYEFENETDTERGEKSREEIEEIAENIVAFGLYLRSFNGEEHNNANDKLITTICEVFSNIRIVAIGNPSDVFTKLHSELRIYYKIDFDDWQERFIKLTKASNFIFIEAGNSEGLLFEIGFLILSGQLQKTIIYFPYKDNSMSIYKKLQEIFKAAGNMILPEVNEFNFNKAPLFLSFNPSPVFLKPKIPFYQYFNFFIYIFNLPDSLNIHYSLRKFAKAFNAEPSFFLIGQSWGFLIFSLFVLVILLPMLYLLWIVSIKP
jgi:hypothetical protein